MQTANGVNLSSQACSKIRNGALHNPVLVDSRKKTVVIQEPKRTKGGLVHPEFNKFCKWVNGYVEGEDEKDQYQLKHNFFNLRDLTKSIWPIYPLLQVIGLFNERWNKIARGFYGACWSIIYSCYRPWKENRDQLDEKATNKISGFWKKLYNANEHFRVGMGSVVSAIYGGGAFGMLGGALTGNDDLFDKSVEVYKTGMFNQNQIFASMNAAVCMKRTLNPDQLYEVDKRKDGVKAMTEYVDTALFLPNIFTRTLATLKLFGLNLMSEGLEKFVRFLEKFSYGTWAARFGIMKTREEKGGDLEVVKDQNPALYKTQKHCGEAFYYSLPALSWLSASLELFGLNDVSDKVFKLEGICERLNPTIAAWCLNNPWLQGYLGKIKSPEVRSLSVAET
ncbi:MAG: hypothetical protein HY094_04050 [Candidatus Melainabacteria bacterium]|nr:hypothetical protein [Candidatus Melainabacteria bacterium]